MIVRSLWEVEVLVAGKIGEPDRTEWVLVEATSIRGAILLCRELGERSTPVNVKHSRITKIRFRQAADKGFTSY